MSDELLRRMDEKLDRMAETQARHGAVLEEHQRRSIANEAAVAMLRTEVEPLKLHVARWAGAGKVLAVLSALGSVAGLLAKLLG